MSRPDRRISFHIGIAACLAAALVLASATAASAATTIGQVAPAGAPADCVDSNFEELQPNVATGPSYVVPAGTAGISSWSTMATAGAGQVLKLKVWRKVGDPATFQVVAQDTPRQLTPGVLNTFPVNLATQPGDVIGLTIVLNSTATACVFDSAGNTTLAPSNFGDFANGQSVAFLPDSPDSRVNISAVAGAKASNDFEITKVKKNKNKGTAVLTVDVPGPGELSLGGPGVKAQRAGGATISKDVTKAGNVTLKVKAKGAKKEKLSDTGKVKVKTQVTFKPAASGGDVAGDPNTEPKKIKLVDN